MYCKLACAAVAAASLAVPAQGAGLNIQFDPGTPGTTNVPLTGFSTTGEQMVGMTVTVVFEDTTTESADWMATGFEAGGAFGTGWSLTEFGDTIIGPWTLDNTSGQGIVSVVVDGAPGSTLFDTTFGGEFGTPNSGAGRTFVPIAGDFASVDLTVTYRDEIGIDGAPPVGDLYRHIDMEFTNAGGLMSGQFITYGADSDNYEAGGDILPFADAGRASGSAKGSLVIIPNVEVRWKNFPPHDVVQDTFVHLTNDYPDAVDVKMFFLNGDPPEFSATWNGDPIEFLDAVMRERMSESRTSEPADLEQAGGGGDNPREHPGWNFLDNVITLTGNEPAYWSAATGLPKGVSPWETLDPDATTGPGRVDPFTSERFIRGFIVAFAVQQLPVGDEIRWNHLAADVTVVHYTNEYAWQYNGYMVAVNRAFDHGEPTGTPGVLNLDGMEYGRGFAELLFNFMSTGSDGYSGGGTNVVHDSDLTLMPVDTDFRQDRLGPVVTKATFDIWNENEVKFTNLDRCVSCWDQELLSRHAIPNHFLIESLHTNAGKVRVDGVESVLCDDSVDSSLLGVVVKLLDFGANVTTAANNLHGLGTEDAFIRYDVHEPPPESNWMPRDVLNP